MPSHKDPKHPPDKSPASNALVGSLKQVQRLANNSRPVGDESGTKSYSPLLDQDAGSEALSTEHASNQEDQMIGRVIGGYKLIELLGRGGMGAVYRAEIASAKGTLSVAIKILSSEGVSLDGIKQMRDRFFLEAAAIFQLHHPNIVEGIRFGEFDDNQLFMVMEFLSGKDLARFSADKALTLGQVLHIVMQVCDGMQAAHERKIIHRDLKLENIFILESGSVKIVDLGLTRFLRLENAERITRQGACAGTAEYMAPELSIGKEYDHRVDIYALGVILYVLLTDSFPFDASTPLAIMIKHNTEEPESPSKRAPNVPEELSKIVMRALEKKPEKRFQTMAEFRDALAGYATQAGIDIPVDEQAFVIAPTGLAVPTIPIKRHFSLRVALASAAIVVFATAASLFFALNSRNEEAKSIENPAEVVVQQPINQHYQLTIETQPSSALVEMLEKTADGTEWKRKLGETPVRTRLTGEHLLVLTHEGYFPAYVEASLDNNVFRNFVLRKMPDPAKR